jgi:hypothetical protein
LGERLHRLKLDEKLWAPVVLADEVKGPTAVDQSR